mgnify:CR=1 FL=1
MTELTNAHFELIDSNKARLHEQRMKDMLDELLKKYDSDDIIAYIMQQAEKD